jgi:hypothetical protein
MIDAEGLLPDECELICDGFSDELAGTIPPEELLTLDWELIGMIEGLIGADSGDRGEPEPELDEELVIEDFSRDPTRNHRVTGPSRLSIDRRPRPHIRQVKNGDSSSTWISGRDGANSGKLAHVWGPATRAGGSCTQKRLVFQSRRIG